METQTENYQFTIPAGEKQELVGKEKSKKIGRLSIHDSYLSTLSHATEHASIV